GSADKIQLARNALEKIDQPKPGQPPVLTGQPMVGTYKVPAGNAEAVAIALKELYGKSSSVRISPVGKDKIVVWAHPQDQNDIARYISATDQQGPGTMPRTGTMSSSPRPGGTPALMVPAEKQQRLKQIEEKLDKLQMEMEALRRELRLESQTDRRGH